jgi:hypothetical protein
VLPGKIHPQCFHAHCLRALHIINRVIANMQGFMRRHAGFFQRREKHIGRRFCCRKILSGKMKLEVICKADSIEASVAIAQCA